MCTKQHKDVQSHCTVMRMKWSRLFLVICPCPPCWSSVALNDIVGFLFLSWTPPSPARCHTCSSAARLRCPCPLFSPSQWFAFPLLFMFSLPALSDCTTKFVEILCLFFFFLFLFFALPVFSSACFDSARRIWILCLVNFCFGFFGVGTLHWSFVRYILSLTWSLDLTSLPFVFKSKRKGIQFFSNCIQSAPGSFSAIPNILCHIVI